MLILVGMFFGFGLSVKIRISYLINIVYLVMWDKTLEERLLEYYQ